MDDRELEYHLDKLAACDPDYVVDVLGLTSEQLINAFPREARAFLEEDLG